MCLCCGYDSFYIKFCICLNNLCQSTTVRNLTGEFVSLQSSASTGNTEGSTTSSSPASSVNLITTNTHNSQPEHNTISNNNNNAPKYGTRVPNRIFVGGISGSTTETELAQLFSGIVYFHFCYTVMYSWTFWPLTMRPLCCLKTSETDYPVICCYIPVDWKPQLYRCKNLKTCNPVNFFTIIMYTFYETILKPRWRGVWLCYSVLEGMTVTHCLYLVLYHVSSKGVMAGTVQVVALHAVQPCNLVGGQQHFRGTCFRISWINFQTSYIGTFKKCWYDAA